MNRSLRACLAVGWILVAGFTKPAQITATDSPDANLSLTIHVYDYG